MSPMWLTSKTPTPVRTVMCSAIRPEYSTGISQPPKSTIFAPSRRCRLFSGVLRSSMVADTRTSDEGGILVEHEPLTLQPAWVRVNRRGTPAVSCSGQQLCFGIRGAGRSCAPYRRISHMIPIRTSTPAITTTRIVWKRFIHLFCIAAPRPDYSPSLRDRTPGCGSDSPRNLR